MKGRGLLIAAAVIQLVGAGLMLLTALSTMLMMPTMMASLPSHGPSPMPALRIMGMFYLVMAGFMTWVSIKLIQRRRWAWLVSLVMSCLSGALMLAVIIAGTLAMSAIGSNRSHGMAGLGAAEGFMMFIIASPVYVVIGLLIAGRRATSDAQLPRA